MLTAGRPLGRVFGLQPAPGSARASPRASPSSSSVPRILRSRDDARTERRPQSKHPPLPFAANAGMYSATGSLREMIPSSTSSHAAELTSTLVFENSTKRVSGPVGTEDQGSIGPMLRVGSSYLRPRGCCRGNRRRRSSTRRPRCPWLAPRRGPRRRPRSIDRPRPTRR